MGDTRQGGNIGPAKGDPKRAGAPSLSPAATLRQDAQGLAGSLPDLLVEAERLAASVQYGAHARRRAGTGESFWEFRPYRPGDPLTRLDWRRSARSDEVFVRERELESAQTLYLWRDDGPGMQYSSQPKMIPTKARRASVLTAAAGLLATRAGERLGVLGSGGTGSGSGGSGGVGSGGVGSGRRAMTGRAGAEAAIAALADATTLDAALTDPALMMGRGRFVFASDFLEPTDVWAERIKLMVGAGVHGLLLVVADPAEHTFPFKGRTVFESVHANGGPTGGQTTTATPGLASLMFGRAELAQRAYQDRYAAHFAALADIARQAGWPVVKSTTDQPASQALLAMMAALAPRPRS